MVDIKKKNYKILFPCTYYVNYMVLVSFKKRRSKITWINTSLELFYFLEEV